MRLKVFYNENQNVTDNNSISPSAGKPKLFIDEIKSFPEVEIISDWLPLTREDFYLVHDKDHVDAILDCRKENGFYNYLPSVAQSLYWNNGSFYQAAKEALDSSVTCSPTSGFHHAGHLRSLGFCTFNGLMITAELLKKEKLVDTVGIIDFDAHYGDGTDNIIQHLELDYIEHKPLYLRSVQNIASWLEVLYDELKNQFSSCNLLLYQAGADCHVDDPIGSLGGEGLTTDEMALRDQIVFQFAYDHSIPIVWNLAGGYQVPVEIILQLHCNTLKACREVYGLGS